MNLHISVWQLLLAPVAFTPLIYLFRRWGLGVWLAALVSLGTTCSLLLFSPSETIVALGRIWVFDAVWAQTMALLFASTSVLFILSYFVSQGWSFYPFGLIIVSLLSLALTTTHLGVTALIVEIAALLAVFIIQGGRLGSVRASLRFLVLMTLAVPLFLLAAWQNDLYRTYLENPAFLMQMALLLAGGFGLWMGVAPFHGWVSAVALEAKPGIAAFIFITFPTTATIIFLKFLTNAPWLIDLPHVKTVMILAGILSVVAGGLFAAAQKAFGPLMGYAALFDFGSILAALGLGSQAGVTIVLFTLLSRAIALTLLAAANSFVQLHTGGDAFEQARGLAYRQPVAAIGLMVGGLTLVGAPFTAGFVSRWLLLQSLSEVDSRWPVIILLGSLGVTIGYIKALRAMLQKGPSIPLAPRNWGLNALVLALIILCLGGGLFPQIALDKINSLVQILGIPIL